MKSLYTSKPFKLETKCIKISNFISCSNSFQPFPKRGARLSGRFSDGCQRFSAIYSTKCMILKSLIEMDACTYCLLFEAVLKGMRKQQWEHGFHDVCLRVWSCFVVVVFLVLFVLLWHGFHDGAYTELKYLFMYATEPCL